MAFFFASEKNKRSANEDSYCQMEIQMNEEATLKVMVVADGMGGLSGGSYYAKTAVRLWYHALLDVIMDASFQGSPLSRQIEMLTDFSSSIYEKLSQKLYKKGLDVGIKGGTTLSAVLGFWDTLIISNCGDSPVYLLKDGELILASEIQNVAGQLVREGKTVPGSVLYYQNKNRLLDYLGRRGGGHAHCQVVSADAVDAVLVGSDGAFGDLLPVEIAQIFHAADKPQHVLGTLFARAREGGEEDNQTAILYVKKRKHSADVGMVKGIEETTQEFPEHYQKLEMDCSYTEVPEGKRTLSLMDKLWKNHRLKGGL